MSELWSKLKKDLTDNFQSLSRKTEELTRIGRLKLEIIAIKRDIEKSFIELGGRVYQAFEDKAQDQVLSDEHLKEIINTIREKEQKLKSIEEKIAAVKEGDTNDS